MADRLSQAIMDSYPFRVCADCPDCGKRVGVDIDGFLDPHACKDDMPGSTPSPKDWSEVKCTRCYGTTWIYREISYVAIDTRTGKVTAFGSTLMQPVCDHCNKRVEKRAGLWHRATAWYYNWKEARYANREKARSDGDSRQKRGVR